MKKIFFLTLLTFIQFTIFSQIKFEKGYFIDNDNKRTECFIKNQDWKNNPTRFDFKITETGEKQTQTLENVKEFAIENYSKFVRTQVEMDTSSSVLNNLSYKLIPENKTMTVFLKLLVDGAASLWYYEDSKLKRYFSQFEKGKIDYKF